MKKFVKNYIGKAKKVDGLEIIKLNLKISDLLKFAHTYKEEKYISIEVAQLQQPDAFGNQYTVYVNRLEEVPDKDPEKPSTKKAPRKAAKKQKSEDDLPF